MEQLEKLFEWKGLRAASVSIDDFYLTYAVSADKSVISVLVRKDWLLV